MEQILRVSKTKSQTRKQTQNTRVHYATPPSIISETVDAPATKRAGTYACPELRAEAFKIGSLGTPLPTASPDGALSEMERLKPAVSGIA